MTVGKSATAIFVTGDKFHRAWNLSGFELVDVSLEVKDMVLEVTGIICFPHGEMKSFFQQLKIAATRDPAQPIEIELFESLAESLLNRWTIRRLLPHGDAEMVLDRIVPILYPPGDQGLGCAEISS